jgi:hypothetical protein
MGDVSERAKRMAENEIVTAPASAASRVTR